MPQPIVRPHRVAELVIHDDATPRAIVSEFLNNLSEDEETTVLAYLFTPEFNAYAVCREIERNEFADDDLGGAS